MLMKRPLIVAAVFLLTQLTFGQQTLSVAYTKTALKDVLTDIESKTKVLFSYAPDVIASKTITLQGPNTSLTALLPELALQSGLIFEKISNQHIIISAPKTACGYLYDAYTNTPLPDALVTTNEGQSTRTDTDGAFSFKARNTNSITVTITLAGYADDTYTLSAEVPCQNLMLTPFGAALDAVVVLGYVTSGIDRQKDGSITLESDKLGILPGLLSPDIAQSIQLIPGISTLDESATGIQIRGGSPDQNLILYDGIKLYNTGYFYGMFSLFNPFATKKAQVFRSGTSVSYGDRISGIIDISSGIAIPETTEGGFEIDGLSINAYTKVPISKKVAVYAFARRSYADILETPTYISYADKIFTNFGVARDRNGNILDLETDDDFSRTTSTNEFSFTDLSAKVILKPNTNHTITASGLYTRNRLDFDFMGGDELVVDSLITQNKGLSVDWNYRANENHQIQAVLYLSEYNSFYQNDEIKDETGDGIRDLAEINIRKNDILDIGLKFSSTSQLKDNQSLTLGYELSNTDLDVVISSEKPIDEELERSVQDDDNLKNALFGAYAYNFKNSGLINGGLRFVHYSSLDQFLIEPRINLEYPLSDRFRFKTALERRHQPISQLVEFNHTELRLENELWRLSDDEQFPLLRSHQISGGLLYHYKNLNIDIDAYYKALEGLTTFTNGFSNPLENLEEGQSTIKGLDILLKYRWHAYKIWAGYTFNDITFQFPNLQDTPFKFSGNNDITHQFRISNTLQLKRWQFSLGWQFRSGAPVTPVNSFTIKIDADGENAGVVNFGAVNSARLPNFHRLDASILHDFNIKTGGTLLKAQAGLSFLNLYNRIRPLDIVYKAERKPLDDGGIAVAGTSGSTAEEREVILEQVIQRFSLGFTPNAVFKIKF